MGTAQDPNQRHGGGFDGDINEAIEGDATYTPPTDPVLEPSARGNLQVVGGFGVTSMDDDPSPPRSVSGGSPDAALEDAIRRELRADASTTDLDLDVEVRDGVASLRGRVADLVDADSALAVAGRVPGVSDVVDELEIGAGQRERDPDREPPD